MFKKTGKLFICLISVIALAFGCVGCGSTETEATSETAESKTCIGIIAALEVETNLLEEALEDSKTETYAGVEFCSGTIGNYDVVVVQCGIGKVSAAACTQAMISQYSPDYVINTGCAGALSSDLDVGDIVIAEKTVEWDIDLQAIGYPLGYISALDSVEIEADAELAEKISEFIPEDKTVCSGLIASGDEFISTKEQRDHILENFPDALCAEMEGASVGHVCAQNGVPFCVIRSMSDNADGDSGVSYEEFSEMAGEQSAEVLIEMLSNDGI